MRTLLLWIALAVAGLTVAVLLGRVPDPRGAPASEVLDAAGSARPAPAGGARSAREPDAVDAAVPPPAGSLVGTTPDGILVADAAGRFVATPSALRLFDHFLSASGEEPLATMLARIAAEIDRQLPASAHADAHALLRRHLAYRAAARELHAEGLDDQDLETRHQRLRELRREHFGPDAERLFAEEEQTARVALALRRLARDETLSETERAERRAALEEALPENVRRANRAARLPAELARRERELLASGATPGALQALREELVGRDAAERLEALDARRAHWQRRIEAYRLERDLALQGAEPTEADAIVARIRSLHFQGPERARVAALDRIEAGERP